MIPYQITIYTTEDQRHSNYVYAGLLKLEELRVIKLRLKSLNSFTKNRWILTDSIGKRNDKAYPWCPELLIKDLHTSDVKRIGIDLQDWDNMYSYHALKHCEVIYKRAFRIDSPSRINNEVKVEIRAFGPNVAVKVYDKRLNNLIKRNKKLTLLIKGLLNPVKSIKEILTLSRGVSPIVTNNKLPTRMKVTPEHPYIFFQVECRGKSGGQFVSDLNDYRANLIRVFKEAFKEKFVGGMYFKGAILPEFADCVSNVDSTPNVYREFVENATVVISTNGFGESIPWKLVEYMQWGCCTVSQRNVHLFREPLPDETISMFDSIEQAVELCRELLLDSEKRERMKANAKAYYDKHIDPAASMMAVIEDAMERG